MDSELLERIDLAAQNMRAKHDTLFVTVPDLDINSINETVKFAQNKYTNIYFELQRSNDGLLLEMHK